MKDMGLCQPCQLDAPPLDPTASTTIIGADGFVGGGLATALAGKRIVFGRPNAGDVHISQAESMLSESRVIINAAGFRVRPGLSSEDYRRSHLDFARSFLSAIPASATLIHMSSASVLGKSTSGSLGPGARPQPETFPSPEYAKAKLEADEFIAELAQKKNFRAVFVRPAVIYGRNGEGMVETLIRCARAGVILRLYPRNARHHLCSMDLLAKVVQHIVFKDSLRSTHFIVADSDTVTSIDLERMFRKHLRGEAFVVPLPAPFLSRTLRHSFHSKLAKFDLATWGEILGVLDLDTAYDPSETFRELEIDPSRYSTSATLEPLVAEALLH